MDWEIKKRIWKQKISFGFIFSNHRFLLIFFIFLILGGFLINAFFWKTRGPFFSFDGHSLNHLGVSNQKLALSKGAEISDSSSLSFEPVSAMGESLPRFAASTHSKKEGESFKSLKVLKAQSKELRAKLLSQRYQQRVKNLQIAKDFFEERNRPFASHMGRDPLLKDKLRYGLLKGRYSIRFYDGKIETIDFGGQRSLYYQPIFYSSTKSFIQNYKDFFLKEVDVEKIIPYRMGFVEDNETFFYETYIFEDSMRRKQEVKFKMDFKNRLISLRVREFFGY